MKNKNEEINKDINKLIYIKDNIIFYFRESRKDIIHKIIQIIRGGQNHDL